MPLTYHGPIPPDVWALLSLVWDRGGLSVQSDWARAMAIPLALCASTGWVSTVDPSGHTYSNRWRLTAQGLSALQHKDYLSE